MKILTQIKRWLLCGICLIAFTTVLTGCGGGASNSGSTSLADNAKTGRVSMSIKWPPRTRLIPAGSETIRVSILTNSTTNQSTLATQLIRRPATGDSSTVAFESIPVGSVIFTASAYPGFDGSGVAQATGSEIIEVKPHEVTTISLTMDSTVDHLELPESSATIVLYDHPAGLPLRVTAKDAAGHIVLLTPSKLTWMSSNPSVVVVDNSNGAAIAPGIATVTVTDLESQKSASVVFTVVPKLNYVQYVDLDTVDLEYDSKRGVLYATTPSNAARFPSSVVPIIAGTAAVGTPIPLDNGPSLMAISGDGAHLYVGGTNGTVKQLALPGGAVEAVISLPQGTTPKRMLTLPKTSNSWIVAVSPGVGGATQSIIYDGITPRPQAAIMGDYITVNESGTRMYGIEQGVATGNHYYAADILNAGLINVTSAVTAMQGANITVDHVGNSSGGNFVVANNGIIANADTGATTAFLTFTSVNNEICSIPGKPIIYLAASDSKEVQSYALVNPQALGRVSLSNITGNLATPTSCAEGQVAVRSVSGTTNKVAIISAFFVP